MTAELSWEYRELAKSVHYPNMSWEFRKFAIERSKDIGFAAAERVQTTYGKVNNREDLLAVIKAYGAQVYLDENTYASDRLSEYDEEKRLVTCYTKTIERIEQNKHTVFPHLCLQSLCLAHELFHHLETVEIGKVSEHVRVPYTTFGFLRFNRGIEATREIAAHAFVMRLFHLDKSPADIVCF